MSGDKTGVHFCRTRSGDTPHPSTHLATPEDPILNPYRRVLGHPTLRLAAVALPLLGAHNAALYPYQSLIATERIGLSKLAFALLLALASAIAVTASVLFGILGDQNGHRRRIALATAFASTLGAMSLAFMALLLFWTFAFAAGANVMAVYVSGGLASLGISLLVLFG